MFFAALTGFFTLSTLALEITLITDHTCVGLRSRGEVHEDAMEGVSWLVVHAYVLVWGAWALAGSALLALAIFVARTSVRDATLAASPLWRTLARTLRTTANTRTRASVCVTIIAKWAAIQACIGVARGGPAWRCSYSRAMGSLVATLVVMLIGAREMCDAVPGVVGSESVSKHR